MTLNDLLELILVILVGYSVFLEKESLKANRLTQQALARLFEAREKWYSSRQKKAPTRQEDVVEAVKELDAETVDEPPQTG